jgi:hypothetical protein
VTAPQNKLAQIRALLAKAQSTEFEHERDALNAKANALIAKYGIDEALAQAQDASRHEVQVRELVVEGPYAGDKSRLAHSIYVVLGAKTIRVGGARRTSAGIPLGKNDILIKIFGYDSDLDRAEILYTSLLIQAIHGMATEAVAGYSARGTMANRRAWLAGFINAVYTRLLAAESRAKSAAQAEQEASGGMSTALVLVDRAKSVEDAFTLAHVGTKITKGRTSYSGHGYSRGIAAGQRADIGAGRVGGATKGAIGR